MSLQECNNAADACDSRGEACPSTLSDGGAPVSETASSFVAETRHLAADPVIARFRAALKSVQASELERLYDRLPELDEHSRQIICQFADCLVAKILHPPLESLRDESRNGPPHGLLNALQRLFRLGDQAVERRRPLTRPLV